MGPNKYIQLTFLIAALLGAFLLAKAGDWVWSFFAKPNDLLLTTGAIAVSVVGLLYAYRQEKAYVAVQEVTRELEKVTWPTRKEVYAATVVVIVAVMVAALILMAFDGIWSRVTAAFLS